MRLGLARLLALSTASHATFMFSQWAILVLLARFTDVVTVGYYGLAVAICTPVFTLTNLGLRQMVATDVQRNHAIETVLMHRWIASIIGCIAILLIAWFADGWTDAGMIFAAVVLGRWVESMSDVCYGVFQSRGRMDLVARSLFLRGPGALMLFFGLIITDVSATAALMSLSLAWGLVYLLHDYRRVRRIADNSRRRPSQRSIGLLKTSMIAVPLGMSAFVIALQLSATRLVTEWMLSVEALGYLTTVLMFYTAVLFMSNSIGHAITTSLSRFWHDGRRDDFVETPLFVALGLLVAGNMGVALVIHFGEEILGTLYGQEYASVVDLLALVVLAAVFRCVGAAFQFAIVASGHFSLVLTNQLLTLAAAVITSLYMVSVWGLVGAGYAVVATAAVSLLLAWLGYARVVSAAYFGKRSVS